MATPWNTDREWHDREWVYAMTPADWDRLRATQRAEEIAAEVQRTLPVVLVTRCAWCEEELPESERDHRANVSHGICERHLAAMREQIRERKERGA